MAEILTSIHGSLLGLDKDGHLVNQYGQRYSLGGLPEANTEGSDYYVSSVTGAANASGTSPQSAVTTLALAFDLVTASQGDRIIILPNHTETIGNATIALDIAGVTVIGVGKGGDQPQFLHSHANSEISVAANNISVSGIRFTASITVVSVGIEIEDGITGTCVFGNRFDVATTTTDEFLVSVRTNDASNDAFISFNEFDMGLGGAVSAISFTADTDNTKVIGNYIRGDYSTAAINGITTLSTKLLIEDNIIINGGEGALATEPCIELVTASTGTIKGNILITNEATPEAAIVADTCMLFENIYSETVNQEASTFGNRGDAAAAGAVSTSESLMAYAKQLVTELQVTDALVDNVVDFQEKVFTSATAVMVNADTLFTVAGGAIEVLAMYSECVTGNDGTASTLQYSATPTVGAGAQTVSGASASLASAAAGATVTLAGTALATAALLGANGPNLIANPGTILVPAGVVTAVVGVGSTTGTWKHTIRYKPLSTGVTVS